MWEENFKVDFTGTLLATDITQAEEWQEVYEDYPNFTEDTGYFIFYLEEDGRDNYYMNLENIMWRKGEDGVWREFSELDLKELNIRGVKLQFRIKADNGITDAEGNTVSMARASSTAKYSVSKLSSAPQVVVNADTMTLAIKNGMEFSFKWGPEKDDWLMIPEYSKKFGEDLVDGVDFVNLDYRDAEYEEIYTNERVSDLMVQQVLRAYLKEKGVSDFVMNSSMDYDTLYNKYKDYLTFTEEKDGIILYVREIGTEKDAASKVAEVIIPCAKGGTLATPNADALSFTYGESKTNTGGILVTNKTATETDPGVKYQVAILTPDHPDYAKLTVEPKDTENIDISDLKWTSIKPGKTMKFANKKVPKGSFFLYRIAGEDGNLPSTYLVSGEIKYDALTYAGIAEDKKNSGETLTAVFSTNLTKEQVSFKWQVCDDPKNADANWTDIGGATAETFVLTNTQAGKYVRVVITGPDRNPIASDYVGPIKATEAPADQNQNQNQQ